MVKTDKSFGRDRFAYLEEYRSRCVTVGREVRVIRGDAVREAFAVEITDDFGLRVRYPDGNTETVNAGEVTIRGKDNRYL